MSAGVKLQIDKKDYNTVTFTTCYAEVLGCRSSFIIEGELEKALLTGKELRIGYKALTGDVIASEVKTAGYTEAIGKF
jgi:invasion protein IalB